MKPTSLIYYFVILAVSLVLAYYSWTGEPKKSGNGVTVLNCAEGDLLGLTLIAPNRSVTFSTKRSITSGEPYWWAEITPARLSSAGERVEGRELKKDVTSEDETALKVFKGNRKLHEALEKFCPWKGLRSLGKLGEEKRALFGLTDSEERLSISLTSGLRQFRLGQANPGISDRYLEDEKTGEIYLVAGQTLKYLLFPKNRYMERSLHAFKKADVARIHLSADQDLDLIHLISQEGNDEGWADSRNPEAPNEFYKNWIHKLFAIGPTEFLTPPAGQSGQGSGCTQPPETEIRLRLTFYSKKKEIGFFSIYRGGEEKKSEYYACTENTEGVVILSKKHIETLLDDLQDIF